MLSARRVGAVLTALVVPLLVAVAPADAAPDDTPERSWGVNGRVYASVIVGSTVVLGGEFTAATSPSGQAVPRSHIAAFDLATGALVEGFTASADRTVRALVADGSTVYVGGNFTQMNGVGRRRIAAVDARTGALRTGFNPVAGSTVYGLDLRAGRLFVGGAFTTIGGQSRARAAALDPATGAVDPQFTPSPDGVVFDIRANPGASTVYLAGNFGRVNGATRTGVAAVNGTTGATGVDLNRPIRPSLVLDMNEDGSILYGGSGAGSNSVTAWNTSNGSRRWQDRADGDIQAILHHAGEVFFGFHDGYNGVTTTKMVAVDASSGALKGDFRPVFNSFMGVFALAASNDFVVAGGAFTRVSGVRADRWVRFPTHALPPNAPPQAGFTSTTEPDGTVRFDAGSSADTDGSIVSYGWDFGDGSSSSQRAPSHYYAQDGTYNVRLTVTDDRGGTGSVTRSIRVEGEVVALRSEVDIRRSPVKQVYGRTISIRGTVSIDGAADAGRTLLLERRVNGSSKYRPIDDGVTDSAGVARFDVTASRNATYRLVFEGDSDSPRIRLAAATSAEKRSKVMRDLGATTIPRRARVVLRGDVTPGYGNRVITTQRKTCKACAWRKYKTVRTSGEGVWRVRLARPDRRAWYFRAKADGSKRFVASYTPVVRVTRS